MRQERGDEQERRPALGELGEQHCDGWTSERRGVSQLGGDELRTAQARRASRGRGHSASEDCVDLDLDLDGKLSNRWWREESESQSE